MASTITFTLQGTGVPDNSNFLNWGLTEALNAFPLQSLFTTLQTQINNVSSSTNLQDVLPSILRMNDNRKLSRYNSMTPSYPDQQYGEYQYAVNTGGIPSNSNNNPLSSWNNNSYDSDFVPRGAFPVSLTVEHYTVAGGAVPVDDSLTSTGATDSWKVGITFTTVEPFVALSPFINMCPMNNAGLLGINNMSIVANIDSSCKRLMGTANTELTATACNPNYITGIQLGFTPYGGASIPAFQNSRLLFNFQTLQPSQYARLSSKNVVAYNDFPRYLTTFNNSSQINSGATSTLTSQNIQLNQVPSLIFINVRIPMSQQQISNPSAFLQIQNISINFNSQSGLLASATPYDLYQISSRNGCAQSYYEWGGAITNITGGEADSGNVNLTPTTGSLLVLNPALDFSMPEYLTGGSLGQFSFQFNITVKNQFDFAVVPEIIITTMNSGIFVSQQGSSVIYTALLDKATTLRTKQERPVLDWNHHQRLVGGRLGNMGLSALRKMMKYHGHHHGGAMSAGAMSAGAESGGAMSAGASSGGRHRLSKHLM
jgi:hypothetical protein